MENATKALLIAAAILVAIIIISLGLSVVRQGQEAVNNADMSEAQIEAFNSKFKSYEGTNVSTANVNALLSAVLSHNQNEARTGDNRYVQVFDETNTLMQSTDSTSIARVSGTNYYTVTCNYTAGLITSITIDER